ncbi:hypothetical protein [Weissella minor]|uniref:hypothetical protein n=1 Tax=Weissella minor TaxID=1620 RepID=UPI003AF27E4E
MEEISAAIDGGVHTGTAVGAIYAGAVGGCLINGFGNLVYDYFAHGKVRLDNFALW